VSARRIRNTYFVPTRDSEDEPLDPVVEKALEHLTSFVEFDPLRRVEKRELSLSKHPSDRAGAIHILKHLKHHRYPIEPAKIREWALAHGWTAEGAQELEGYAAGVVAGTRYHTAPDPFGQLAIHRWRSAADKSE
jgi:hypothetical protein